MSIAEIEISNVYIISLGLRNMAEFVMSNILILEGCSTLYADLKYMGSEELRSNNIINTRAKLEHLVDKISVSSIIMTKLQDKGKGQIIGAFTRINPHISYIMRVVDDYAVFISKSSIETLFTHKPSSDDNVINGLLEHGVDLFHEYSKFRYFDFKFIELSLEEANARNSELIMLRWNDDHYKIFSVIDSLICNECDEQIVFDENNYSEGYVDDWQSILAPGQPLLRLVEKNNKCSWCKDTCHSRHLITVRLKQGTSGICVTCFDKIPSELVEEESPSVFYITMLEDV